MRRKDFAELMFKRYAVPPEDRQTYAEYCNHFKKQEEDMGDHSLQFFFDDIIPKDGSLSHFFRLNPTEKWDVDRIVKSGPVTIVFWSDGTKTMVRRAPDEEDNNYAAFTAALAIKLFGSNSALKRMLKDKVKVQKPKKTKQGGCSDTCPIDFDAIEQNLAAAKLAKSADEAGRAMAAAFGVGNNA